MNRIHSQRVAFAGIALMSLVFGVAPAFATGSPNLVWKSQDHTSIPAALAYDAEGDTVVSAGFDGMVYTYSAYDGGVMAAVDAHAPVHSVAVAPDGQTIAAGMEGKTNTLMVMYRRMKESVVMLPGHALCTDAVKFTPNGARLITGGHDGLIKVWDTVSWKLLQTIDFGDGRFTIRPTTVSSIDVSPDGQFLAAGGPGALTKVYDLGSGRVRSRFPEGYPLAFTPDGSRLAIALRDTTIGVYDIYRKEAGTLLYGADNVIALAFSPKGVLAAGGYSVGRFGSAGVVHFWLPGGSKPFESYGGWMGEAVTSIAYSPTNKLFTFGCADGMVVTVAAPAPEK